MKEFEMIVDKLQLFEKLYEAMRVVDPVRKKILEIKENEVHETDTACYEFWKNQMICDNCISIRAYNEDDTFFKIEAKDDKVYMITAVPITINGKRLVVELLKNTTNSLFLGEEKQGNKIKILATLEYMNQVIVRDELTNLYNRRYISEKLPVDLLNAVGKNEPISIVFADLDYFKNINDVYGHSVGDQVLQAFAVELKNHIRSGKDWAARYGGEEFLICLPCTDNDTAKSVADRIRKDIMEKEFNIGDNHIHLTCSFGVYTLSSNDKCPTIEDIIKTVDIKLYQVKADGRNKVV